MKIVPQIGVLGCDKTLFSTPDDLSAFYLYRFFTYTGFLPTGFLPTGFFFTNRFFLPIPVFLPTGFFSYHLKREEVTEKNEVLKIKIVQW